MPKKSNFGLNKRKTNKKALQNIANSGNICRYGTAIGRLFYLLTSEKSSATSLKNRHQQ
jgi:hypothetical protein